MIEGQRAILARTPDLLELAGSVAVPAGVRGLAWDDRAAAFLRSAQDLVLVALLVFGWVRTQQRLSG